MDATPIRILTPGGGFAGISAATDLERRFRHELEYDHLVIALGAVTNFFGTPGAAGRALRMKSLGDCAAVPDPLTGGTCRPTAQHAFRQGSSLARNIAAAVRGEPLEPFVFTTLGQLAAIGRRTGVASILGRNFSGFVAWWLWRTIYLAKLPRLEKKVRVALDRTLDLLFSRDLMQFDTKRARAVPHGESVRVALPPARVGDPTRAGGAIPTGPLASAPPADALQ
jgi:hypothetical protein